jgi:hypothetical protein
MLLGIAIASVWIFHGLYSKILDGIPRHRAIVSRILGDTIGPTATIAVGLCEVLLGIWVLSGRYRCGSALVQTIAIASMNTLEIARAKDLLVTAPGMVLLNLTFLTLVWYWACAEGMQESDVPGHHVPVR